MKKNRVLIIFLFAAVINIPSLMAQSLRGQSINGSTGLYSLPSGLIGWENSGNLGIDFGYRAVINNDEGVTQIPALTISLFNWVEISSAFDFQPALNEDKKLKNSDLLLGIKFKLPTNVSNSKNPGVVLGGNVQIINIINDDYRYFAYQPYVAITYAGSFFDMSAETTVVFGKTFYSGGPQNNSNIDFGMGFDLVLFPDVFKDFVHWIIDFANFSYSDNSWPNNMYYHTPAWYRGVLNTGFRIDLSAIPIFNKNKFLIDLVFNDLFDSEGRSFTAGAVFGFSTP